MSKFRRLLPTVLLGLAILAPAGLVEAKTHHSAAPTHLVAKTKKKSSKKKHHKKKHKKHTTKKKTSAAATKSPKAARLRHA